jgi:hypothetical protein
MPLRVRFAFDPGSSIGYSIERLLDGLAYDFGTGTFVATPGTPIAAMTPDSGVYSGRYRAFLAATPADHFLDGEYTVTFHDTAAGNTVLDVRSFAMADGDDRPPAGRAVGFVVLAGSTATSVLLAVPANTPVDGMVGRALCHLPTQAKAAITAASLTGTTAILTLGPGWPAPAAGDVAVLGGGATA